MSKYNFFFDTNSKQVTYVLKESTDMNKEIKMIPEMLNLLGCSKENFKKLLKSMGYKLFEKDKEVYFKYLPKKSFRKPNKVVLKESPFEVLKKLNLN